MTAGLYGMVLQTCMSSADKCSCTWSCFVLGRCCVRVDARVDTPTHYETALPQLTRRNIRPKILLTPHPQSSSYLVASLTGFAVDVDVLVSQWGLPSLPQSECPSFPDTVSGKDCSVLQIHRVHDDRASARSSEPSLSPCSLVEIEEKVPCCRL